MNYLIIIKCVEVYLARSNLSIQAVNSLHLTEGNKNDDMIKILIKQLINLQNIVIELEGEVREKDRTILEYKNLILQKNYLKGII